MMQSDVSLTKQFHPDFVLSFLLTACQTPAPTFSTRTLGHVCPPHLSVAKLLQCNSQSEPSIGSDRGYHSYFLRCFTFVHMDNFVSKRLRKTEKNKFSVSHKRKKEEEKTQIYS